MFMSELASTTTRTTNGPNGTTIGENTEDTKGDKNGHTNDHCRPEFSSIDKVMRHLRTLLNLLNRHFKFHFTVR